MSIPTLPGPPTVPNPAPRMPRKRNTRTLEMTFGDGYSQSTEDGLNSVFDSVSLVWPGMTETAADELDAFFTERAGSKPFYWTYPRASVPQKWKCKTWDRTPLTSKGNGMDRDQITATFTEVFDLDD